MSERTQKIIKWLNMILSGCWFTHDNLLRVRDERGVLHYECERCRQRGAWYGTDGITRTHTEG